MTKTTMGPKSPYEIRLEILQMAKDHLDATFKAQCDFASQMIAALLAANRATVEELMKYAPKAYSPEDIAKEAAQLYTFVQKKE